MSNNDDGFAPKPSEHSLLRSGFTGSSVPTNPPRTPLPKKRVGLAVLAIIVLLVAGIVVKGIFAKNTSTLAPTTTTTIKPHPTTTTTLPPLKSSALNVTCNSGTKASFTGTGTGTQNTLRVTGPGFNVLQSGSPTTISLITKSGSYSITDSDRGGTTSINMNAPSGSCSIE